ncbi:MAG: DNA-directed RNA polymerase subunit B'' [Candidatus Aenigmatarchaeota archaeon]
MNQNLILVTLLKSYLEEYGLVKYQIDSYNDFVLRRFPKLVKSIGTVEPQIPELGDIKIHFIDARINEFPTFVEADGVVRSEKNPLLPYEARIRGLTYSSPMYFKIVTEVGGIKSDPVEVYFGQMPVMVKSVLCPLSKMSREELIKAREDPDDPGGYFIINGVERNLILIEELANNKPIVRKVNQNNIIVNCRINSEKEGYIVKHLIELKRNGIFLVTFSALRDFPLVILFKALGIENDETLLNLISEDKDVQEEFLVNLYEYPVVTQEEALDKIGEYLKIPQKKLRKERAELLIDKYFLLHLGQTKKDRINKAIFLAKIVERMIKVALGKEKEDDIDHYANKRVRLAGELFEILFRTILKGKQGVISRMIFNYQKLARRGSLPPLHAVIDSNFVTNIIQTTMAVGTWIGNRTGTSQRLERTNLSKTLTHMRVVSSPLKSTQEHFEARELHPTHYGKLCLVETPEGPTIGLRKHLAVFSEITFGVSDEEREKIKKLISENIDYKIEL